MASQSRKGGVLLPPRRGSEPQGEHTILAKLANSDIVSKGKQGTCNAVFVTKKLLRSTGKAAWIAGTTFLILVVPLIIEMDREQQFNELDIQQQSLLGSPLFGAPQK